MIIQRFDALRFPLVVAVIFIHTNIPLFNDFSEPYYSMWRFLAQGVSSIAVPVFFFISGYLFFYNFDWSYRGFLNKLKNRVWTLLIPYLAWNALAILTVFMLYRSTDPQTSQMWFLRDLMILTVITPVIHHTRRIGLVLAVILVVLWVFRDFQLPPLVSSLSLVFFYLGAVVSQNRVNPFALDRFGGVCAVASVICFVVDNEVTHKLGIITGVVSVLALSKYMVRPALLRLSCTSFFLFMFHQPFVGILLGWILHTLHPNSDLAGVLVLVIVPVVTVYFGVWLYYTVRGDSIVFRVLNGGRA